LIFFKEENFKSAAVEADKAMQLDPANVKSYYRRGNANLALKGYEAAIMDFEVGLKYDEANTELKKCLALANKQ